MLNLILTVIVAYYLVKTGDLFKLIKLAKKFIVDLFVSLKKETESATATQTQQAVNPIEILKIRYAKGEISESEFEKMRRIF
ncbi:SHOCT domain-containing protein [Tepidibacillus fermentans]|uniref:Putative oligomerization/nucleic acid binding protein n=1 Tax=Tepidibacillus fermentans TaxID=1281767 RepID=A0A4R3K550_9BACI|nr:SHOCT domain-containing protein [Tepidibacillus fermentans]TCS77845.1 putative oligomerization/nucleic acid binding protein [Tepidibacillus fermentans]